MLLAALFLPVLSAPSLAASCAPLHEEKSAAGALAAENHWMEALKTKDTSRAACRLSDDFMDTTWRGQLLSKDNMLAALKRSGALIDKIDDISVQFLGDVAIIRGLNMATPAPGASAVKIRFTDVFVYRNGYWQAVSAQETLEQ